MKKIKQFIDNLPDDKKSHVCLGELINLPIILISMIIGWFFDLALIGANLGFLACLLVHGFIEFWQKYTNNGKLEFWDFAAGSYSAIALTLAINVLIKLI